MEQGTRGKAEGSGAGDQPRAKQRGGDQGQSRGEWSRGKAEGSGAGDQPRAKQRGGDQGQSRGEWSRGPAQGKAEAQGAPFGGFLLPPQACCLTH